MILPTTTSAIQDSKLTTCAGAALADASLSDLNQLKQTGASGEPGSKQLEMPSSNNKPLQKQLLAPDSGNKRRGSCFKKAAPVVVDIVNDPEPIQDSSSGILLNDHQTGFCSLRPLGLNSGCSVTQLMSFPEFIAAEICAVFPGLLTGAKGKAWTVRVNSFFQFIFSKTEAVLRPIAKYGILEKFQFDSLCPGKCVVQEVADILINFVSRILGGNFVTDSHDEVLSGITHPWSQYLQTNEALANKLLVLSTQHALHLQVDSISSLDRVVRKWAGKLHLDKYKGSLWPICAKDHYTTAVITQEASSFAPQRDVMLCRLADSGSRDPALDPKLSEGFAEAFRILCPETTFEEAEGLPIPQQEGVDCLFHTVLFQASKLTGVPLPEDEDLCRMDAFLLRFYCYLLFHRDMQDRGLPIWDMSTAFEQWKTQQQDSEGSHLISAAAHAAFGLCLPGASCAEVQQVASPESDSPILRRHRTGRRHVRSESHEDESCSIAGGFPTKKLDAVRGGKPEPPHFNHFDPPAKDQDTWKQCTSPSGQKYWFNTGNIARFALTILAQCS